MNPSIVVPVVLAALTRSGRIMLLKRRNEPFRGLWGMPGGKVKAGEFATSALEREVREETGLGIETSEFLGIVSELITEDDRPALSQLISLFRVRPSGEPAASAEGGLRWFPLLSLDDFRPEIIPSDYAMIGEMLMGGKHGAYACRVRRSEGRYSLESFVQTAPAIT